MNTVIGVTYAIWMMGSYGPIEKPYMGSQNYGWEFTDCVGKVTAMNEGIPDDVRKEYPSVKYACLPDDAK